MFSWSMRMKGSRSAFLLTLRGLGVTQSCRTKAGKGGHAGKRRPRSATCMQILHYACDKTSDSLSSYTETGSMYYTNISTSKPHTEVSKNHSVYRRKVPLQMALAEESPKTAAAVDHHRPEALIATTSQDGRHTHGYHFALPLASPSGHNQQSGFTAFTNRIYRTQQAPCRRNIFHP